MISIIVAVSKNGAIGKNNNLLWHISDDLKRFKAITSEHTVVMGTKTYESLPFKPLPKRENIVITRNKDLHFEGCTMANSIEEIVTKYATSEEEIFVIGGANIYEQFLPYANKLYITWVYEDFDGDVFFPCIDETIWKISEKSDILHDEKSNLNYSFFTYLKQ
jgi:dihydrofolate reductase